MTPNFPLLDQALAWAEREHPKGALQWDQGYWFRDLSNGPLLDEYLITNFCNTSCCIAGYVATRNGERPLIEDGLDYALEVQLPDGSFEDIEVRARALLGLTVREAVRLFEQENTLDDLRRIVAELKEKHSADA